MTKYTELPRPAIFAHRGASAYAPENTLAAFRLAIAQGAPALELDALLSADGHVVVIHDDTVNRTTGSSGYVRQMSLKAIKELDAGLFFHSKFKGEKIPTLAEVFETIGGQIVINVEIKNYATPFDDLPSKIAYLVQEFNLSDSILFSSFNPIALIKIGRILPKVPRGLLILPGKGGAWARAWIGRLFPCQALHPDYRDVTAAFLDRTHRSGRRLHAYTVNQPVEIERMFSMGIDGIFTDDPPLALKKLEQSTNRSQSLSG